MPDKNYSLAKKLLIKGEEIAKISEETGLTPVEIIKLKSSIAEISPPEIIDQINNEDTLKNMTEQTAENLLDKINLLLNNNLDELSAEDLKKLSQAIALINDTFNKESGGMSGAIFFKSGSDI